MFCICLSFSSIPFVLPYFTKCRLYYTFSNKTHCCTLQLLISILFFKSPLHCVCTFIIITQYNCVTVRVFIQSEKFVMLGFFPILAKSVFSTKFDPCNHDQLIILSWVKKVNFINFSSQILSILDCTFFPDGSITNNMTPILFHKNCTFFIPI